MTIKSAVGNAIDTTGSVTNCATTTLNAIKALILTHPAWSLVEDINPGTTSTYRWVVFKCDHTVSGLPADFYVVFTLNTTAGQFSEYVGETYNSTTHTLTGIAAGDSTSRTPNADTTSAASMAPATVSGQPTITGGPSPAVTINQTHAAAVQYLVIAYDDHLVVTNQTGSTGSPPRYHGAFTSAVMNPATNDPMPLVSYSLGINSNSVSGYTTRHPFASGAGTFYWYLGGVTAGATAPGWGSSYATAIGGESTGDLFQGGAIPVVEGYLYHLAATNTSSAGTRGGLRGKFKSIRNYPAPPTGMRVGDTITLNGTTWTVINLSSAGSTAILADCG